jgi:hypothetical protein
VTLCPLMNQTLWVVLASRPDSTWMISLL